MKTFWVTFSVSLTLAVMGVFDQATYAHIETSESTAVEQHTERPNPAAFARANIMVNSVLWSVVGLVWLGAVGWLRVRKGKSWAYVLFFTIFYIYLYKVIDYTLLQFQLLLLLQYLVPGLMLQGFADGTSVNLLPLTTLTAADLKTSLLNLLMFMPFGFGLPFISSLRFKLVVLAGFCFSVVIELLQFLTGWLANTTFRVADINDLLFNTVGAAAGYGLFIVFVRLYRRQLPEAAQSNNPVWRHIATRPRSGRID